MQSITPVNVMIYEVDPHDSSHVIVKLCDFNVAIPVVFDNLDSITCHLDLPTRWKWSIAVDFGPLVYYRRNILILYDQF